MRRTRCAGCATHSHAEGSSPRHGAASAPIQICKDCSYACRLVGAIIGYRASGAKEKAHLRIAHHICTRVCTRLGLTTQGKRQKSARRWPPTNRHPQSSQIARYIAAGRAVQSCLLGSIGTGDPRSESARGWGGPLDSHERRI